MQKCSKIGKLEICSLINVLKLRQSYYHLFSSDRISFITDCTFIPFITILKKEDLLKYYSTLSITKKYILLHIWSAAVYNFN